MENHYFTAFIIPPERYPRCIAAHLQGAWVLFSGCFSVSLGLGLPRLCCCAQVKHLPCLGFPQWLGVFLQFYKILSRFSSDIVYAASSLSFLLGAQFRVWNIFPPCPYVLFFSPFLSFKNTLSCYQSGYCFPTYHFNLFLPAAVSNLVKPKLLILVQLS